MDERQQQKGGMKGLKSCERVNKLGSSIPSSGSKVLKTCPVAFLTLIVLGGGGVKNSSCDFFVVEKSAHVRTIITLL